MTDHGGTPQTPAADASARRTVEVPYALRATAGWAWRLLLIGVVIYLLGRGFVFFEVIMVPLLVSLLLVALLRPLHQGLMRTSDRVGLPPGPAALLTILIGIGAIAALITLISQQISSGFSGLRDDAVSGLSELQRQTSSTPTSSRSRTPSRATRARSCRAP